MELIRCAANKPRIGPQTWVEEQELVVDWDSSSARVRLQVLNASGPEGACGWNWDVYLTMDDIALILRTLSDRGIQNSPSEVQQALQSNAVHLVRLLGCAAGNPPGALLPPT